MRKLSYKRWLADQIDGKLVGNTDDLYRLKMTTLEKLWKEIMGRENPYAIFKAVWITPCLSWKIERKKKAMPRFSR